jgi:hypothetical protein
MMTKLDHVATRGGCNRAPLGATQGWLTRRYLGGMEIVQRSRI